MGHDGSDGRLFVEVEPGVWEELMKVESFEMEFTMEANTICPEMISLLKPISAKLS